MDEDFFEVVVKLYIVYDLFCVLEFGEDEIGMVVVLFSYLC